jgi:phosphoribosylamine--glycine ligase
MGAYAPVPAFTLELLQEALRTVLQRAVDGMLAEGTPYVGVLYAGLILTPHGLRVLEFNCRFGDPETQVILPLLETDLIDVIEACLDGRLAECDMRWKSGAAATVVAAAPGYPGSYPKGAPIHGVDEANTLPGVQVFHAGTKRRGQELVTDGGRVLSVTGLGDNLRQALDRAYAGIARIHFDGMHYRKDIGARAIH